MLHAARCREWSQLAGEADRLRAAGGRAGSAKLPYECALRWRMERLRHLRLQGDAPGLMCALRVHLARHAGSIKDGCARGPRGVPVSPASQPASTPRQCPS